MRLLLVEDDDMIGEVVLDLLRQDLYAVDRVRNGTMADEAIKGESYDLVVLDLGLPDTDGLDWLKRWRQRGLLTPVLIATARDASAQRVAGLDAGADDYVVKPYDFDELLARIRALLRRSQGRATPVFECQGVAIDLARRECRVLGKPVLLSAREWAVLDVLVSSPGRVFSRSQLEEKLYDWKHDISSNAVEVHIHGLRKKLGADFIRNARGVGYWVPES